MKKTHIAVGAMAIALVLAPLAKLQAPAWSRPLQAGGRRPGRGREAKFGKGKLGKKKHIAQARAAQGRPPGTQPAGYRPVATNRYWSGKAHKCMDARDKA